jgi:hypothetical protein
MVKVRLNRQELAEVQQAAALRWQLARASAVANQKRAAVDDSQLDVLGLKAECAVAKLFGVASNTQALGIDSGQDVWVGEFSIDVKATFHQTGVLLFKSAAAFKADCAVLVTVTEENDVMNVVGGISRKMFLERHRQADLGRGPCLVMGQDEIWPIETLWRKLAEMRFQ